MAHRAHPMAVVRAFLVGCVGLLVLVGCAGVRTEAPKEKQQGHTAEATASEEQARCEGTRTIRNPLDMESPRVTWKAPLYTNDLPECPNKGGPLLGTDGPDELAGEGGDDEVRGRGDKDVLGGGVGDDVIYGGPGDDTFVAGKGDDVLYGGDGSDSQNRWSIGGLYGARARASSMAGMATISCLAPSTGASGTSSIAARAGTNTSPTRTTMCRAVAR